LKSLLLIGGLVGSVYSVNSSALDLDEEKIRGESNPKPVTVLQNRYFLKTLRPEIGLAYGAMLNEAYTKTRASGVRLGLFASEWVGAEIQYFKMSVEDTEDRKALNTLRYRPLDPNADANIVVSPDPEINPIRSILDFNVIAAPFYGKMNLLDKHIIYSDLYLSAGLSKVDTSQGNLTAFSIGAGQRFYFSGNWSVRFDFKDRIYSEKRSGKDSTKHAYSIDFGASYFFR
jgi:outer membrane beta-barrel protein